MEKSPVGTEAGNDISNGQASLELAQEIKELLDATQTLTSQIDTEMAELRGNGNITDEQLWQDAYYENFVDTPQKQLLWEAVQIIPEPIQAAGLIELISAYSLLAPDEGYKLLQSLEDSQTKVEALCSFNVPTFTAQAHELTLRHSTEQQIKELLLIGKMTQDSKSLERAMHEIMKAMPADDKENNRKLWKASYIKNKNRYRLIDLINNEAEFKRRETERKIHNHPVTQLNGLIQIAALGYKPALVMSKRLLLDFDKRYFKGKTENTGDYDLPTGVPGIVARKRPKNYIGYGIAAVKLIERLTEQSRIPVIFQPDGKQLKIEEISNLDKEWQKLEEHNAKKVQRELEKPLSLPEILNLFEEQILSSWQKINESSTISTEEDLWQYVEQEIIKFKSLLEEPEPKPIREILLGAQSPNELDQYLRAETLSEHRREQYRSKAVDVFFRQVRWEENIGGIVAHFAKTKKDEKLKFSKMSAKETDNKIVEIAEILRARDREKEIHAFRQEVGFINSLCLYRAIKLSVIG